MDSPTDWDMEEAPYTNQEKRLVIDEISRGLFLGEIHKKTSKKDLKNWFADVTMKHTFGEWCPDITGQDLIDIAEEFGIEVI